jgi:Ca-activated chloride channel homolog
LTEEPSLLSDQWREEGPWLLLALLPFAALAFRRGWLLSILACVMILPPTPGWAFEWSDLWWTADQQAARQFEAGANAEAAELFRDPAWRAAASYRAGDYERALAALSEVPDP